jgi:hypothetical protein
VGLTEDIVTEARVSGMIYAVAFAPYAGDADVSTLKESLGALSTLIEHCQPLLLLVQVYRNTDCTAPCSAYALLIIDHWDSFVLGYTMWRVETPYSRGSSRSEVHNPAAVESDLP